LYQPDIQGKSLNVSTTCLNWWSQYMLSYTLLWASLLIYFFAIFVIFCYFSINHIAKFVR